MKRTKHWILKERACTKYSIIEILKGDVVSLCGRAAVPFASKGLLICARYESRAPLYFERI